MSTGPKTTSGRQTIAEATRQRMVSGQRQLALEGFFRWLENGGREMLKRIALDRQKHNRWLRQNFK
jgi:hypothetical protein